MHRILLSGLKTLSCVLAFLFLLLFSLPPSQAKDKPVPPEKLKIGFLMDSLKVERWQTDVDKFQKRAGELGADVLIETAEGDDELQLQQARRLLLSSKTVSKTSKPFRKVCPRKSGLSRKVTQ